MPKQKRGKPASPLQVAGAVLAAFFGVRRRSAHESVWLNPVHVIFAGVLAAAVFVVLLVALVKFIVGNAGQ